MMTHLTILSGAQTGVDTAAIHAALALQLPFRGWVPHGFTNEAGTICDRYRERLRETPSSETAQRTEWNVRDADVVLTLLRGPRARAMGGTKLGVDVASEAGKPMCFADLAGEWEDEVAKVREWMEGMGGGAANYSMAVGGPRESEEPGIQEEALRFLIQVLRTYGPRNAS